VITRPVLAGVALAVGVVAGLVAEAAGSHEVAGWCFLGAAVVVGELLELRLDDGSGLPLSYAPVLVLAASTSTPEYFGVVVAAEVVAAALRVDLRSIWRRVVLVAHRVAVAAATLGAWRLAVRAWTGPETTAGVLTMLLAVVVVQLALDGLARRVLREPSALGPRGRLAWLALGSSGMLMAIGYRGVDGEGDFGIWGPLLFSIPLLAAWYSFERLHDISRTQRQTIEALSAAPELAGIVRPGHGARVADLSVALAEELGLVSEERHDLHTAALLHHLGQVTLDDPEVTGRPSDSADIASVTAEMLREIEPLAAAGEIIGGHSARGASPAREGLSSQILKVASAFDDLTDGLDARADAACEVLASAPGYLYDARVVEALQRVVACRQPGVGGERGERVVRVPARD
jgi:hypothetical protein